MRRVVVTGIGIVSCLGNNKEAVLDSLQQGRSGIKHNQSYVDIGMRSHISGSVDINAEELIDRKLYRFMGDAAAYAYLSMKEAVEDSGLSEEQVSHFRTGLVVGSGGGSSEQQLESTDIMREKGLRRVGPYRITRTMSSTVSACLATPFKIKGVNYTISSACATSAHCIGHAAELIQLGKQDVVFAGGGEAEHWTMSHMFDAMGALSTNYNETPEKASRAFDAARDGFVIAGGGAVLVIEELEHAKARGAKIYAELTGYGATSTAMTWSRLRVRVARAPCKWPCTASKGQSITSILTVRAHQPATYRSCARLKMSSVTRCQHSIQPNRSVAIPSAPLGHRRLSTAY